jgi:hypothetical protein
MPQVSTAVKEVQVPVFANGCDKKVQCRRVGWVGGWQPFGEFQLAFDSLKA